MPVDMELNEGDRVIVDQNLETFKHLSTEYGGWDPDVEKVRCSVYLFLKNYFRYEFH